MIYQSTKAFLIIGILDFVRYAELYLKYTRESIYN